MLLTSIPFFPDQASTTAGPVDLVYFVILGLTIVFGVGTALVIAFLAIRYRRGSNADRSNPIAGSLKLELGWTIIPFILAMVTFAWASSVYFDVAHPPEGAMDIYVVGRQWMWKLQHPTGQREINELHVPVGVPVKLVMTSQDVIHSFYIPAFRMKQDVVPGMVSTTWFQATQPGRYHLYCAEFCGTEHSMMGGWVTVMEQPEYEQWLRTTGVQESMAQAGSRLFREFGCSGCHAGNSAVRAPMLEGVYGKPIPLADGSTVVADDLYIRDSILLPKKHVVGGYDPIMPSFQGQIKDEDLMQLIYYIKSLK